MGNYVNEALLDASPYKKQADEAKSLVSKWDKTGLLDGLNEDFQKNGMAVMLENQAKQLISENSATGGGAGTATAGTAGTEEWSGVALPLVRRIFGEIAAQDFVSVQPMNLPSGLVFYLDFKYGKTVEGYGQNSDAITGGKNVESIMGKEYKEAVVFLKDKLHEVNILNAKLLFTNKLFKSYSLDNNQKLKVVETFDRAQTTREIKLVYSTLAEQFSDNNSIVTRKSISESASAPVSSTKPSKESKKVISEESQVANRFKKLAGLIK